MSAQKKIDFALGAIDVRLTSEVRTGLRLNYSAVLMDRVYRHLVGCLFVFPRRQTNADKATKPDFCRSNKPQQSIEAD